jgi:hypothetical protein
MEASRPGISRRWFLRAMAFLPALSLGGLARRASAQGTPPPKPSASPAPAAPASAAQEISPDVEHLTAILQRRYGKLLTPEQLQSMAPELNRVVQIGDRLRKASLTNADEPDIVFSARTGK